MPNLTQTKAPALQHRPVPPTCNLPCTAYALLHARFPQPAGNKDISSISWPEAFSSCSLAASLIRVLPTSFLSHCMPLPASLPPLPATVLHSLTLSAVNSVAEERVGLRLGKGVSPFRKGRQRRTAGESVAQG